LGVKRGGNSEGRWWNVRGKKEEVAACCGSEKGEIGDVVMKKDKHSKSITLHLLTVVRKGRSPRAYRVREREDRKTPDRGWNRKRKRDCLSSRVYVECRKAKKPLTTISTITRSNSRGRKYSQSGNGKKRTKLWADTFRSILSRGERT